MMHNQSLNTSPRNFPLQMVDYGACLKIFIYQQQILLLLRVYSTEWEYIYIAMNENIFFST